MTKMARAAAVVGLVGALGIAPASAALWADGGLKETTGGQNYNGASAYGEVGVGAISVKPMFSSFHNNLSVGTFNTYSLRLGYDTKLFGIGLTGGATPTVNGYSNKFGGVDAVVSISPTGEGARERINGREQAAGPAQGRGLARIDIGGSAVYTSHADHTGSSGQMLASVKRLGQTDLTVSGGVSFLESLLSVDVTKTAYDQKPANTNIRAPRVEYEIGLANVVQGFFPNTNTNLKLLFGLTPLVKPYIQYTRTTYQVGVPNSNAYSAGLAAELAMLQVSASYERFKQSGQPDLNYVSVGAGLRF